MNFILNFEGFEKYLVDKTIDSLMGVHYIFKFENGYGASVVKGQWTYGGSQDLWELAVLHFYSDGKYDLAYDTEITDNVKGHLHDEEVLKLLGRIKALKKPVHIEN